MAAAAPAFAQTPVCGNGRNAARYTKDARVYRPLAISPTGPVLVQAKRVGRLGVAEWATAVSVPIADNLTNRDLVAADVRVAFKSLTGTPAIDIVSYWYSGYQWDGAGGGIESASAQTLYDALQTPHWVYGSAVFPTRAAQTILADNLAGDADEIAWDEGLDTLSFFVAAGPGAGYGELSKVTLTLYTCPLEGPTDEPAAVPSALSPAYATLRALAAPR